MEALHLGDTNNNGKIEVTELAEYVKRRVPALFVELKQSGWVGAGADARTQGRGRRGGQDADRAFGSTDEDFSLVVRLP